MLVFNKNELDILQLLGKFKIGTIVVVDTADLPDDATLNDLNIGTVRRLLHTASGIRVSVDMMKTGDWVNAKLEDLRLLTEFIEELKSNEREAVRERIYQMRD